VTFRLLLVGLGNRARMWGRIVAEEPDLDFAGIVDIDPARVAAFTDQHGQIAAFDDLALALAATAPDAVVLVTPPDVHLEQARTVFAAGIPLLSEKPLTLDLAEAATIVREGEAAGVPLSVGLNFRYLPISRAIRELVAAETFGPPGYGTFAYMRNRDWWRPGMNKYPLSMRHPMMLEQSIHHLDLIRFCYGREVIAVSCRTWSPPWSAYAHDANVSCLLSLEGGLEVDYVGTWTGGWNALKFQWRTDCPDGVIVQRELFCDLATARTDDPELTPVPLDPCEPFLDDTRALLRAFVIAIRSGTPVPCDGRDHMATLALCFAAIEAAETGRRVRLDEFCGRFGLAA
jgi:predicted dehydrogenase